MIQTLFSQIPDKDLEERRTGQKVDPLTGITYIKEVYAPEKPTKQVIILLKWTSFFINQNL